MHKRMSLAATSWYAKNGVDHDFAMQFFLCVTTLSSKIGLSVLGSFFCSICSICSICICYDGLFVGHNHYWPLRALSGLLLILLFAYFWIPLSFKTGIFVKIEVLLIAQLASIMVVLVMHSVRISMNKKSRDLFFCQNFWTDKIKCYMGSQKSDFQKDAEAQNS